MEMEIKIEMKKNLKRFLNSIQLSILGFAGRFYLKHPTDRNTMASIWQGAS